MYKNIMLGKLCDALIKFGKRKGGSDRKKFYISRAHISSEPGRYRDTRSAHLLTWGRGKGEGEGESEKKGNVRARKKLFSSTHI